MPAYKNPKTNTWYVKFRYKNWRNESKDVTKRGFSTKREAVQWERDFLNQQSGNLDMTMGQFVEIYMENRNPRVKRSTAYTKDKIIENKILPYFRDRKLSEITPQDIVKWQNELLKYVNPSTGKPYSKSYLKEVHNQMTAIFNHAIRFYKLPENPARIAGNIGSEKEIRMKFWTESQYRKFEEEMQQDPQAHCCFQILYWCGIREGELLALTPEDFDFSEKTVSITKTFQRIDGQDMVTSPKTPKSYRKVVMPDFLSEDVKRYITMNYGLRSTDRIFNLTKSTLGRKLQKGAEKVGLPRIRVHDLRHSHVSLLIDMGFGAVSIAERMGHESIDITYRYAHMFPTAQIAMAEELNRKAGS